MTLDERLEAVTMNLELGLRELEEQRIAFERHQAEFQRHEAESAVRGAKIDARIEKMLELVQIDAENIRSLARVAEAHERRLDQISGRF